MGEVPLTTSTYKPVPLCYSRHPSQHVDAANDLAMRYTTTLTVPGGTRARGVGARRFVILLALLGFVAWMAFAYAQEAYLAHRLSQQASDLRHQNALIAAQNQGYHKDVQARSEERRVGKGDRR